jgi:glycosyltransferase involved in cell wall biosynthesis
MRILHLLSCRGWSSDAYWASRVCVELERRGHRVTLGYRAGTDERVGARARDEGVRDLTAFAFAGGVRPREDASDVRRLAAAMAGVDVVHVHRGKEHWLAAVASRLARTPRPIVRTRHIVQAVRPHAGNRWLYGRATALVTTVTDAIRRQYLASGLVKPERVVAIPGGVDADRFRPRRLDEDVRRALGARSGVPLIGMVAGFRVMKGHAVVVEVARRLAATGVEATVAFIGQGPREAVVREHIGRAGLSDRVRIAGFASDLPSVMASLDVGLYAPLESEGMSRVVFEYLGAGTPLVAARVGVVPEVLVDGQHAILVPAGDPGALAEILHRVLGDPERRRRLGREGRALIETRYSGARVAESIEHHYRAVAALAAVA